MSLVLEVSCPNSMSNTEPHHLMLLSPNRQDSDPATEAGEAVQSGRADRDSRHLLRLRRPPVARDIRRHRGKLPGWQKKIKKKQIHIFGKILTVMMIFYSTLKVFHMCQSGGRRNSFLCPVGTLFDQRFLICNWWGRVVNHHNFVMCAAKKMWEKTARQYLLVLVKNLVKKLVPHYKSSRKKLWETMKEWLVSTIFFWHTRYNFPGGTRWTASWRPGTTASTSTSTSSHGEIHHQDATQQSTLLRFPRKKGILLTTFLIYFFFFIFHLHAYLFL